MEIKKIGFVIADDAEFVPVEKYCEQTGGETFERHMCKYCRFEFDGRYEIVAVLGGVGKVNSAATTAALICEEAPDCIINFGLSGAVSKVYKNEIVIGKRFYEHDFDLTPLGYKPGEKSRDPYYLDSDKQLNDMILSVSPDIIPCVFVTGDCFVADSERRQMIIDNFEGNCCDMETAAIASVCRNYGVPFASIRYLSDSADDNACESYTTVNELSEDTLLKIVLSAFEKA